MRCREATGKTAAMAALAAQLAGAKSDCWKMRLPRLLKQEAEALFDCPEHAEGDHDCKNCRAIAARRRRVLERLLGRLKTGMPGGAQ